MDLNFGLRQPLAQSIDSNENTAWAMKYGVQGIPTMLFIANGKVVYKQVGTLPEQMLRQVLDKFLLASAPVF